MSPGGEWIWDWVSFTSFLPGNKSLERMNSWAAAWELNWRDEKKDSSSYVWVFILFAPLNPTLLSPKKHERNKVKLFSADLSDSVFILVLLDCYSPLLLSSSYFFYQSLNFIDVCEFFSLLHAANFVLRDDAKSQFAVSPTSQDKNSFQDHNLRGTLSSE